MAYMSGDLRMTLRALHPIPNHLHKGVVTNALGALGLCLAGLFVFSQRMRFLSYCKLLQLSLAFCLSLVQVLV